MPSLAAATQQAPAVPLPVAASEDVTQVLEQWNAGDFEALERLMPLVYADLRRLAQRYLDSESPGHTLPATAIVHELYVQLTHQKRACWQNRTQFFAVAATMIRRILVTHARHKHTAKRGGGVVVLALEEALQVPNSDGPEILALDDALETLAEISPRQSRIVEMRFFGGLKIEETAAILGISTATVKLDWKMAKAWLYRELSAE